ncbi:MAG: hypothetical protein QNK20_16020 [Aureibaculum sp.]|nr:hypothetical protein [Aureibaculum sp.]
MIIKKYITIEISENDMFWNKNDSLFAIHSTTEFKVRIIALYNLAMKPGRILSKANPITNTPIPKIIPKNGMMIKLERKNNPGN